MRAKKRVIFGLISSVKGIVIYDSSLTGRHSARVNPDSQASPLNVSAACFALTLEEHQMHASLLAFFPAVSLSLSPSRRRRGERTSLVAQMQPSPSPALQLSLSLSIFFTPPRTLLPPRYNLESSASSPNWKFFWHQIARSNCTPRFLSRLLDSMVRPPPLEHCESATHSRESHCPHRRERARHTADAARTNGSEAEGGDVGSGSGDS